MIPEDIHITTHTLLIGTVMFIMLDAITIPLLAWRVIAAAFRKSRWLLVLVALVVWFGIWNWAIGNYWETVYSYLFPDWAQEWIPPVYGLVNAAICLGLWSLAMRTKYPAIVFCLLGGVWGVCGHIWAVFLGIVTKPPMLQGASPVAAVLISFFEYIFYWCVIAAIAALFVMLTGAKSMDE